MKNKSEIKRKKFRANYEKSTGVGIKFDQNKKAKQSDKDDCDINHIMKRFEKTGLLPEMIKKEARYGDFSDPIEYQQALNMVHHAEEQFNSLSARVRERFGNDPEKFLEFAQNPANNLEMAQMGLLTPEAVERLKAAQRIAMGVGEASPPDEKSGGSVKKKEKNED